jgi:putative DNA primase/helicase
VTDERDESEGDPIARMIEQAPTVAAVEELGEIPHAQWDGDLDGYCAWRKLNDLGNARRLQARHGADMHTVAGLAWHTWHAGRWDREEGENRARLAAHRTAEAIYQEAAKMKGDDERAKALRAHAHRSSSSWSITAMLREAEPYLAMPLAAFDAHPELVTVANGTLELGKQVRRRPHRREDYITKLAPIAYDADADYPLFKEFLADIQPRPEIREFLQRWFGYCLTGWTHEQVMLLCHGGGANGKSTLLDAVRHVLGDYAVVLPFASLLRDDRRRGAEPSPDIARLPGVRLVTAAEPELGRSFSEATIKTLTGEDTLIARRLHQEFFEFTPQFKLVVCCNNRPTVRGQDEGIWRRLLLVPFDVVIPPEQRSKTLQAELRAEAPGILNWLVEGARLYCEGGLAIPETVRAATRSYREESDPIGRFLADWCLRGSGVGSVRARRLYQAYKVWCDEEALDPMSQTKFGLRLGDRGIGKMQSNGVFYLDVTLTAAAELAIEGSERHREAKGGEETSGGP